MPEVICLISSSPPSRSATSPSAPAPKPRNAAAKLAAATAIFDMTGTPSPTKTKTKKTYTDSRFSAVPKDGASGVQNQAAGPKPTTSAAAVDPKLSEKEYVFLDDDYSSDIDLDKEYSLHLSQVRERVNGTVVAAASANANAMASSPIAAEKVNSEKPKEKASEKPRAADETKKLDKPNGMGNKEYIFLDDDFSSSIDLDKEYDLGLPAAKKRRVTPPPELNKEVEKHGLPDLFSSPRIARTKVAEAAKEVEKHGLPELFSSPEAEGKAPLERANDAEKHALSDPFSPSSKRMKAKQAPVAPTSAGTSNLPATQKTAPSGTGLPKPMKRTQDRVLDSDPITFTSSPDFAQMEKDRRKRREQVLAKAKQLSDIDEPAPKLSKVSAVLKALDSDSDDLPELPSMAATSRALSRTTSDTSYLNPSRSAPAPRSKPLARSKSLADSTAKSKKRVPKTADEKAAEAAEKQAAKEAEAEKKRIVREEKARDKVIAQDLAKVNTLKTDKKKSTPEMIVLFPQEMDKKLRETAEGFLGKLSVEYRNWAGAGATPGEVAGSGMVKNVVRWKRKVDALYNDREDIWEPVPRRIENEKHVLVHLPATEFVELATGDEGGDLDEHAVKLKSRFDDHKIIYLIEGLTSWQKKNTNLRNRQFASAVRAQIPAAGASDAPASSRSTSGRGRKKKPPPGYISDDLIEDALLSLQIKHKVLIHHTASLVDSAEWISIFTQHISTIPYRLQKMNLSTSFCMESGQVRAGEDARDTFVKMLCEMRGVTAPVGWGVEAEVGREDGDEDGRSPALVMGLVELFRREGKEALAQVKKSANRDGAFTDRNVGKAISRRVFNVFMGRDAGSTDV